MSEDILYLRRATVQAGPVVVKYDSDTSLRIRFKVVKNPQATEPNRAHVEIYNLSDERRDALDTLIARKLPVPLLIEAGYANAASVGAEGRIFKGTLQTVAHSRDRGDWGTKLVAADATSVDVPVSATYKGPTGADVGTIAADLLKQLAKAAGGLDVTAAVSRALEGDLSGVEQQFNKAVSVNGMGMDVLERLVSPHGFRVSQQDGQIQLIKVDDHTGRSVILDATSGLVGAVDPVTDSRRPGVFLIRARSLLRHDIRIGTGVEIRSLVQRGLFVVELVEHHGDTHGAGNTFITLFQGRGIREKRGVT